MKFEQCVKGKMLELDHLRHKTINDLTNFVDTRPDIEEFDWISKNTSNNLKRKKGNNISNNMKLRCIGAAIGLVSCSILFRVSSFNSCWCFWCSVVGALLGAGAGYVVGKCLDKIEVTNMQRERSC
ncbi:hypothetical protein [Wolbachia endosymbiont of Armadillidium arcangelii]|uniref:Uncharacterized protein n=1 Tax=Wolbachia endosymbiont of Armadillidium arcangelii TaxID=3158571 RepID=A0AAU7Q1N7_9RICK